MSAKVKRPTIVLAIGTGWGVRTFLQTDVLPTLRERARVAVLAAPELAVGLRAQLPDLRVEELAPFELGRGDYGRWHERRRHHFLWLARTETRRVGQRLERRRTKTLGPRGWRKRARWWALRLDAVLRAGPRSLARLRAREREAFFAEHAESAARYRALFEELAPALVVSTVPHVAPEAPSIFVARAMGIPTAAWINSWDNLTSKGPYPAAFDRYLVWSERMLDELRRYYPETAGKELAAVGVPHFDWYRDERMCWSREELCRRLDLDPERPIVLYAGATPYLAPSEHLVVERLSRDLESGGFAPAPQLVIRPHPGDDGRRFRAAAERPGVTLQMPAARGAGNLATFCPSRDESRLLVNTIRHADVVINLSSTVTIEAAIVDRPVINVAYDLDPAGPDPILEENGFFLRCDHYKTVVELGAARVVRSPEELVAELRRYLAHPERERAERARLVELWCGDVDGRAGRRLGQALLAAVEGGGASPTLR